MLIVVAQPDPALFHRCAGMSSVDKTKGTWVRVLLVIPGPKEPSSMQPYLQETAEFFKAHGPSGEELQVLWWMELLGSSAMNSEPAFRRCFGQVLSSAHLRVPCVIKDPRVDRWPAVPRDRHMPSSADMNLRGCSEGT